MKILKEKLSLFLSLVMVFGNLFLSVPVEATQVVPELVAGNPSCSDLG